MHPSFTVFGTLMSSYAACIAVGAVLGVLLAIFVIRRRKMHYGLEVIINRFGPRSKPYYIAFVQLLAMALFGYLTYRSVILYIKSGSKILATTRISYKWVDAGAIVGFALMTVYSLEFLIEDIKKLKANKEEKS